MIVHLINAFFYQAQVVPALKLIFAGSMRSSP